MYEQALRIDPRDQESLKARKNLAAEGALRTTGIATAQSSHELIKDKEAQRKLERSSRLQLSGDEITSELADLERKLADNPRDRATLRRVADLRELQGDAQGALAQLDAALRDAPNDAELQARAGDIRLRLQEQAVRDAQQRGDEGGAARARAALAELRVAEMKRRVAAHPTDLTLRFELGSALLDVGQVDASIAELQQAVKDPRRKTDALVALGRAFRKKNLPELAHGQFTKALDAAGAAGDAGKAILYELADLANQLGRGSEALAHYSRILEQDINYRDVALRVDELKNTKT
jgi:tetratricopeptide (TPR) repeat protein